MTWAEKGPPIEPSFPSHRCSGPDEVLSVFANSDMASELKHFSSSFLSFFELNCDLIAQMVLDQDACYCQSFYVTAMAIFTTQAPEVRDILAFNDAFLAILLEFPEKITTSVACGRFCKILEHAMILSEAEFLTRIPDPASFLKELLKHIGYLSIFDFFLNLVTNDSFSIILFLERNHMSDMLIDQLEITSARENVLRLIDYLSTTIPRTSPLMTPLQDPKFVLDLFQESLESTSIGCARAGFDLIVSLRSQHPQVTRESNEAINDAFPRLCEYIQKTVVFNAARVSALSLFLSIINDVYCPPETTAECSTPAETTAPKKTKVLNDSLDLFHINAEKTMVSASASSPRIEGRPPLPPTASADGTDQPLRLNEFSRPNFLRDMDFGMNSPVCETITDESEEKGCCEEEEEEEEEEGTELHTIEEEPVVSRCWPILESIEESDETVPPRTPSLDSIQEVDETEIPASPPKKESVHFSPLVKRNSFDLALAIGGPKPRFCPPSPTGPANIPHMRSMSDVERAPPSPFPIPDMTGFKTPQFRPAGVQEGVPAFFHKRTNTAPESPLLGGAVSLTDLFRKVSPDIPDPIYVQTRRPSSRPSVRCDSPQIGPLTFSPMDESPVQNDPDTGKPLSLLELAQHDKRRASLQTLNEDTFGHNVVKQLNLSDSPVMKERPKSAAPEREETEGISLVDLARHSRLSIEDFQRPTSAPILSPSNSPPYASCMQSQPIFNCAWKRPATSSSSHVSLAKSCSNGSIKAPSQGNSPRSPYLESASPVDDPEIGCFSINEEDPGCFAIEEVADEELKPAETTEIQLTDSEDESQDEISLDRELLIGTCVFLVEQFFLNSTNTFLHNAVIDILNTLFDYTPFVPDIIAESHMIQKILEMYEHKDPKMSFWGQLHHLTGFIRCCPEVIPPELVDEWNQYIESVYEPAEEIMNKSYGGDFPDVHLLFADCEGGRVLHPDI